MKNNTPWYLRLLVKLLFWRNMAITKFLIRIAHEDPNENLGEYMSRFWLLRMPAKPGEPGYGTFRNWLRNLYPFYARFHWIKRADEGVDSHNHPFNFTSIILVGFYTEEVWKQSQIVEYRVLDKGDINQVKTGQFHRISDVSFGGCLTLVFHTRRKTPSWDFDVQGVIVDRADHFRLRKFMETVAPNPHRGAVMFMSAYLLRHYGYPFTKANFLDKLHAETVADIEPHQYRVAIALGMLLKEKVRDEVARPIKTGREVAA